MFSKPTPQQEIMDGIVSFYRSFLYEEIGNLRGCGMEVEKDQIDGLLDSLDLYAEKYPMFIRDENQTANWLMKDYLELLNLIAENEEDYNSIPNDIKEMFKSIQHRMNKHTPIKLKRI